jgi:hypothetical protein
MGCLGKSWEIWSSVEIAERKIFGFICKWQQSMVAFSGPGQRTAAPARGEKPLRQAALFDAAQDSPAHEETLADEEKNHGRHNDQQRSRHQ